MIPSRPARRPAACALVAALLLGAAAGPCIAQPALAGAPTAFARGGRSDAFAPVRAAAPVPVSEEARGGVVRVGVGAGAVRQLSLPRGKSAVIELPVDARDVVVANPRIADVALSTPRRIYVMGASSGRTDATFVDGVGRQILRLDIRVDQDAGAVADTLARLLPGSSIRVESANDSLVLSGEAANAAEVDQAVRLASAFVSDPKQVVSLISITGGDQVMLKVKIVEVNRTVIKQLGFDLNAIIGQIGGPQYLFSKAATYGVAGALLGGLQGGYKYDSTVQPDSSPVVCPTPSTCAVQPQEQIVRDYKLSGSKSGVIGTRGVNQANATIQAFERVGLVRTLAEPNLTAVSGESAHFLAGGEFPVPVSEDAAGRVTVTFKPFGVGLGFTPVVLSKGRISLKISTEVSELTNVGGFTLSNTSTSSSGATTSGPSLSIPGLNVRRAETVVELPSGGAMAIAGLMQSQSQQTLDSLPGLMQLPVLGSLFRSRDFQNNETELVVIVTPYLVKSTRPDQLSTPADGLVIADDLQTNLLGRVNAGFSKPAPAPGKTYQGPFGYVVD